ncbi:MAG: hypothetical protein E7612_09205 [Ruminococcaceae bacterium]|nr:hypothetical protein [Oscillospiraceae bacterium]
MRVKGRIRTRKEKALHISCTLVTLACIGFGFLFPNGIPRLAESIRDLGVSIGYYIVGIISPEDNSIIPTVTELASWQFAESPWKTVGLFPFTWPEFKVLMGSFWEQLFTKSNFNAYINSFGDKLYFLSRFLLILMPLSLLVVMKLKSYTEKQTNERNVKSKQLKRYEKIKYKIVYPIVARIKDFALFSKEKKYLKIWVLIWLLYFNIFSVFIEAIAFYLYFIVSFDFIGIYRQVLKLFTDLTPMIKFLPGIVWFGVGVYIYNHICRSMAFNRIYYYDRCNQGVLKDRGVVTTVYGEMGVGKTQLITAMAITSEINQWDMAFEILLEKDLMFPNFPWQTLRDAVKKRIDAREIVDIPTAQKWVRRYRAFFDYIYKNYSPAQWQHRRQNGKSRKYIKADYTFGYDYEHYPITYNDELKLTHLYEALEDYVCAYLVYTVKSTLIFANYSIRVDSMLEDLGNFPLRNNDFMQRDVRLQDAYSRHAKIIDMDMFRLGKKMLEDNPKARRLSFGTFVISEVDKERKNQLELKEMKQKTNEVNQKNDLFNACLMMCRHACVIANRVFIRIICDLQRPEAWGAGGRELGEVIYIKEKSEISPTLPFFSPFWLLEGLFKWFKAKWTSFHAKYIHVRSDDTLFAYVVRNTVHKVNNHYDKVNGLFGVFTLHLEIESGRMDGNVKKAKWRIILKKDRSKRYSTDCLSSVFDSYKPNTMHIDDFEEYATVMATMEEGREQHSYFQNDIHEMKQKNEEKTA